MFNESLMIFKTNSVVYFFRTNEVNFIKMTNKALVILLFTTAVLSVKARETQSPPRFVKQPPTDEVLFQVGVNENDKPFFIECEATAEPAPKYVLIIL